MRSQPERDKEKPRGSGPAPAGEHAIRKEGTRERWCCPVWDRQGLCRGCSAVLCMLSVVTHGSPLRVPNHATRANVCRCRCVPSPRPCPSRRKSRAAMASARQRSRCARVQARPRRRAPFSDHGKGHGTIRCPIPNPWQLAPATKEKGTGAKKDERPATARPAGEACVAARLLLRLTRGRGRGRGEATPMQPASEQTCLSTPGPRAIRTPPTDLGRSFLLTTFRGAEQRSLFGSYLD
jgi:hypothetical protein